MRDVRSPARRASDVASVAVFTALIIALGAIYIPVPFSPVAVTGQTLGVLLAANLLGAKRGTASVALFLLLIAAGLPVLAGGRGGIIWFTNQSGGYLGGFLLAAFVVGLLTERLGEGRRDLVLRVAVNASCGVFLVYLVAVPRLAQVIDRSLGEAIASGAVPFLPGDLVKAVIAALVADRVLMATRRAGLLAPATVRSTTTERAGSR